MQLSKYVSTSIYILIILLTLSGARLVSSQYEKPLLFISKQQSSINVNNQFWTFFHLGQKRLFSSLVWIATILESDIDHYKNKDLNSWMFLRFNSISYLEPLFYENYAFGGVYLSIVKDDLLGASIIYDKGLALYPDDFNLLKDAGFHYYFEVGDFEKSYPIYKKLSQFKNASPLAISAFARLESQSGNLDDAFHLLEEAYSKIQDKNSVVAKKYYENMYAIKAEKDLDCLNSGALSADNCSKQDLDGNTYSLNNGKYVAQKKWTLFRTKRKVRK